MSTMLRAASTMVPVINCRTIVRAPFSSLTLPPLCGGPFPLPRCWSAAGGAEESVSPAPALDQTQRVVGQRYAAVLLHHLVEGAHQAAAGAVAGEASFDDFALHVNGVAGEDRRLHIELHVQEGQAGMLHGRLH